MGNRCLFVFDFDDTLYSHVTKRVPESTQRSLLELNRQGHQIVIASGRGKEAIAIFKKELAFVPDTLILMNGQIVCRNEENIYENHIELSELDLLFEKARNLNIPYGGYYENGSVVNQITERVNRVWTDWNSPLPLSCDRCERKYPIYQAHLYITREESRLFEEQLKDYIPNWSHECLVNLIHKSAGKSKAIKECMREWNISYENTYAFGDGFNDVDMIETVCHGVAMENGFERLKEKAEYVTKSAAEEGIYKALKHYGFME